MPPPCCETGGVPITLPRPWINVVVDMQRLFGEATVWHTPSLADVVAPIGRLVSHAPDRTVFTRFMTPVTAVEAVGVWGDYYRHWSTVTTEGMSPDLLDIVPALSGWLPPALQADKTTHSAFNSGEFASQLAGLGAATVVLCGVETDVCVLATAMDAIDRGIGVIVATDAVTSSDVASHRACLDHVYPRFDQQVRLMTVDEIVAEWP